MNREKLEPDNLDNNIEESSDKIEDLQRVILEEMRSNTDKETGVVNQIEEGIKKNSPDFKKKISESGALQSLSDKIKKSKLLRAGIIAFNLCSASPALASGLEEALNKSGSSIGSVEAGAVENSLAEILEDSSVSNAHKKELEEIYINSSDTFKKIIIDELEGGTDLDNENVENLNNHEDSNLLVLQQQTIDLQTSGLMGLRKEGNGVVTPFDPEHSGETNGVEFINNDIAEDGGKQKITIENASESQIRAWVDYLKNTTAK